MRRVLAILLLAAACFMTGVVAGRFGLDATPEPVWRVSRAARIADRIVSGHPIAAIDFDAVPLRKAIEKLAAAAGVEVRLDEVTFAVSGPDLNGPVSYHRRDVELSVALEEITPRDDLPLTLFADGGRSDRFVVGSAVQGVRYVLATRTYDLLPAYGRVLKRFRELDAALVDVTDRTTPTTLAPVITAPSMTGCFGPESPFKRPDSEAELNDEITQLIMDTIESDSWKDNGGTIGSMRVLNGYLIVTTSEANHADVAKLLGVYSR